MKKRVIFTAIPALILMGSYCLTGITTGPTEKKGVVSYYNSIPPVCSETKGIKQKTVKKVNSTSALESHYKITMLVRFQDKVSPSLYGTLYYQDRASNLYCMALPDGRFASFSNSQIDQNRKNMIQEICYPIQKCAIPDS